ncbi:MAG: 2-oxoacid:ferredoxin oxidoreductase subunit gamma [Thermoprotei archaeon]|nr:MAG: 2-oxoacid:ferredoxin oxidoreductase subunit gamma [Thermoprotei archaeon]RLF17711.1 MAG: 2-oxoacid:ferredoxin oxidoreductase subunit gamma [Thermoprotei archaeon]
MKELGGRLGLRLEVGVAGIGGQGVLVAGSIIGKAAVLDGFNASQSVSYGAEVRGTLSLSELVLSDGPIAYPFTSRLDALIIMSERVARKALRKLKLGGLLVIDEKVKEVSTENYKAVTIPAFRLAEEKLKKPLLGNLILVGALSKLMGIPSLRSLEKALIEELPEVRAKVRGSVALEALRLGFSLVVV